MVMSLVLAFGLGAAALVPDLPDLEHRTRLTHGEAVIDVRYGANVTIIPRQIGAPAKAGTLSTLRCLWRADVEIERRAEGGAALQLTRTLQRETVLEGSRPGWCAANRKGIAREVARRADEIRADVAALAERDEAELRAELHRAGPTSEG